MSDGADPMRRRNVHLDYFDWIIDVAGTWFSVKEGMESICALSIICALCAQMLGEGRFYSGIRMVIGFRIVLIIVNIVKGII